MLTVDVEPVSHAHFFTGILNATVSILGCLVTRCMLTLAGGAMQEELTLPATSTPLGNVSVSGAVRLAIVLLGLFKVMVSVEVPPAEMVAGLKDLFSVGATLTARTVKVATAGAALLPMLVCKAPGASALK
jgi:hypothetical protein